MNTNMNKEEFEKFISSEENVLVSFSADWCGPCRAMAPLLEKAEKLALNKIAKINVDNNPEIAAKLGVRNIPTVIVFRNSQVINRKVGSFQDSNEILQLLN